MYEQLDMIYNLIILKTYVMSLSAIIMVVFVVLIGLLFDYIEE